MADAGWQAYVRKITPLIVHQESRILNPAPFFAAQLQAMIKSTRAT
jgi:hypothetical protein